MRRLKMKRPNWIPGCLAAMVALLVACSTDTPTAPVQEPSSPTPAIDAFIMSIKASPDTVVVDSEIPATVTVRATLRSNGQSVANGTTAVVSTTLGVFFEVSGTLQTVPVVFDQGKASVILFPGDVIGTASLRAELEGSVARNTLRIEPVPPAPVAPFITSISPNTGPEAGGTSVTIGGVGFREPIRVFFGDKLAEVSSVTDTQIRARTPPGDIPLEVCSLPLDLEGVTKSDTPVQVRIDTGDGTTATLANAFTYIPGAPFINGVCIEANVL